MKSKEVLMTIERWHDPEVQKKLKRVFTDILTLPHDKARQGGISDTHKDKQVSPPSD
jgi:hypothetical protein